MSNLALHEMFDNDNKGSIYAQYTYFPTDKSIMDYCSCRPPSTCIARATISQLYVVPGMIVACFPVESALQSTLTCFYNQTCINELREILNETSFNIIDLNSTALDSSLSSRYSPETKIEEIFNQIMLENISWNASHVRYYETCRPSMCFYTIKSRNNPVYVLTMILGLIGGLSSVLQVIIQYVIKFVSKLIHRFCHCNQRRNEVQPF